MGKNRLDEIADMRAQNMSYHAIGVALGISGNWVTASNRAASLHVH